MRQEATLTPGERERLEMNGYSWGRDGKTRVCYRWHGWTDEEAAAFRKGYEEGVEVSISLGEKARG